MLLTMTLNVETDLLEYTLKTFVTTLTNGNIFLIQPEAVLLAIYL